MPGRRFWLSLCTQFRHRVRWLLNMQLEFHWKVSLNHWKEEEEEAWQDGSRGASKVISCLAGAVVLVSAVHRVLNHRLSFPLTRLGGFVSAKYYRRRFALVATGNQPQGLRYFSRANLRPADCMALLCFRALAKTQRGLGSKTIEASTQPEEDEGEEEEEEKQKLKFFL